MYTIKDLVDVLENVMLYLQSEGDDTADEQAEAVGRAISLIKEHYG
tara:strand:- start:1554 stop:1691 length:138 start_codon:yes stop_codon:yes gene_type:complete